MAFIRDLLKKIKGNDPKIKKSYASLNKCDPMDIWNVIGEIGDGAFGKVFKAENRTNGVIAALKQVNLEEEGDLEEYIVEIEILTECKHSNVINLYAAYHFENKLWMSLEYCNGGALDSLMMNLDKNLNEKAIKYASKEILSGIIFLHGHAVIHRDMKAGNVLVTKDADIKLADFGVSAKLATDKQKRNTVQGTPYWMAPEVISCQNMESFYDYRADIWSFGITLIELAQMRPPYHQMQPTRVLIKIAKADPPTLDKPHLWSDAFNAFLKKCLTKKPEDRPYAAELINDPFITSCDETDKRSLKVLIHEVSAENIEETIEDLDLKDVRHSLLPSQTFDDLSENDDMSIESSEQLDSPISASNMKGTAAKEIMNEIIDNQIKSESDKVSILGVVCDVMENNSSSDTSDTESIKSNPFIRHESVRMAMEIIPDMPEIENNKEEETEKESLNDEEWDQESNEQLNINRKKSFYKTMTKTRKFVVDGEEITTTTTKVVREGLENKNREQIQDRKMEIRELQVLAKEESRQKRQMKFRILSDRENLLNRLKAEESAFERNHEVDMDNIIKSHKAKMDKIEIQIYNDIVNYQKKLLSEKARKEIEFKNKDKETFNKEFDKLSKNRRKDNVKRLKENQNVIFQEKYRIFQDELMKDIEEKIEIMTKNNRKKIYEVEVTLLKEKHQKLIKYNKDKARLTIDQCQALYQLDNQHKKEMFMLGRQQVKHRQDKEIENLEKNNKKELDELDYIQANEKKTFPKFIKSTSRTRNIQKKGELEIQFNKNLITNSDMKSKLKEFDESEREREKSDLKRMELKLVKKRQEMVKEHGQRRNEYTQLHGEQRKELTDQENIFLREVEKKHKEEILEFSQKAAEKESIDEEVYRKSEEKLKMFYNVDENTYGNITPYSTKAPDEKKFVEALC